MFIDLWYPLTGTTLPADHGYPLYSALCGAVPELHGASWWGLHTIPGTPTGGGDLHLSRRSHLGLRLPHDHVATVLPLAGKQLRVAKHQIRLGPPQVHALEPAPAVSARIVVIKGFMEPEPFRAAVDRQLEAMGVQGSVQVGRRMIVGIGRGDHRHRVVGFSTRISELKDDASVRIMVSGIGGRRRFGCGLFRPSSRPLSGNRE